jgi:hypothetical protein
MGTARVRCHYGTRAADLAAPGGRSTSTSDSRVDASLGSTPRASPPPLALAVLYLLGAEFALAISSFYPYEGLESCCSGHIVGRRFGRVVLFLVVRPMAPRQVGVVGDSNPWCSRLRARTGVSVDPSSAAARRSLLIAICADRGVSWPIVASFASALVPAQCTRLTKRPIGINRQIQVS